MPSLAFESWMTKRAAALGEIDNAHRTLRGSGSGKRITTQQINQAYVMLLSGHFQAYSRDLHSECADALLSGMVSPALRAMMRAELQSHRKLDRGNPNPGNLGADFGRFGIFFWGDIEAADARSAGRKLLLEEMNLWRNAVAHQDFDAAVLRSSGPLTLAKVRSWRGACHGLADTFDNVMRRFILNITGTAPW